MYGALSEKGELLLICQGKRKGNRMRVDREDKKESCRKSAEDGWYSAVEDTPIGARWEMGVHFW